MADIVFPGQLAGGPLGSDYLPANYDLALYKGDYFTMSITLKDSLGEVINLTGYSAQCQMRTTFVSLQSFDVTVTIPDPLTGVVKLEFMSAVTTTLSPGPYIWDFQVTDPSGNIRTYIAGDVTVYGEVTT